jgi:hypothetical protein
MLVVVRADVEDLDRATLAQRFEPHLPGLPDPAALGQGGAGLR